MERVTKEHVAALLPPRSRNTNKGSYGKALLVAGSPGFSGAAVMSAAAAERAGVGTLRVACPPDVKGAFSVLPEVMVFGLENAWHAYEGGALAAHIAAATCIAIGPGMGQGEGVQRAVGAVLASKKSAVVDADGLNALSKMEKTGLHGGVVLTPHPAEMGRITGADTASIVQNPKEYAAKYAEKWGCTVLLKGADSVIASADGKIMQNTNGNPGLAKGGSGDVLTGIILAMLGQGLAAFDAACAGAYILGASADEAVMLLGQRMLMARDVIGIVEHTVSSFLEV